MWIDQKFIVLGKIFKKEKGSLLDLGSRDQILKKFLPNEISYVGVDISKNIDESNLIVNLNNKLDFGDNSYDFVTALDVAEHLDDPKSFLDECLRVSRKNVFIVLPNISYYESRLHFMFFGNLGSKYHFSGENKDDRHKWFINFHLINNFFKKNHKQFKLKSIIKTRNKLQFLFFIEKFLAKLFPNLFSWSFLITLNKDINN